MDLTDDQKNKAHDEVNNATNKDDINKAKDAQGTSDYNNSDQGKKDDLDKSITDGEKAKTDKDATAETIKDATKNINDAIDKLNGGENGSNTNSQADTTTSSPDTIGMTNILPGKSSQGPSEKTVDGKYMHAAIGYDKNGKPTKNRYKSYDSLKYIPKVVRIKGRNYYKLAGKDEYVLVTNVTGRKRTLKRNAYVYNSKGQRIAIIKKLKKGKKVTTYGKAFIFKNGKKYYRVGKGQYIRVINFVAPKKK
ncbi:hypothetical protein FC52_GL001420 [Lactobacillus pasteurii DSM 23907 = CRBIP 24.76]|uniref:Surface layer protein SlpX n=1 Tax=Lactobacillus pasteurii DSM 23907 = CRBIP 24.76 TaxID=1423790 RepID=I7JYF2_9LACO|nr:SLAP domain-containing protein [Lactobacillus pasteurii]KRK07731.1 hypothetical protein FC52_GL001420 [Lactobacillus pasteurii DSM 23907 = CRBIP 24.76]TDG77548.1 hypothetical protein C5L33_000991 [Lactobacillus pasteurii]CCI85490.1 Surface layer protein SlpX [Lactobacillus pasteurii DSM 23907 = CRBIP 24.76]